MTINVTLSGEVATRAITYNLSQAAAVEGVATQNAVSSSGFVFFAAFDGTGNTLNNSPVSNNQTTNVSALFNQFTSANAGSTSAVARYYNGMGTPGTIDNSSWLSSSVTAEGISTATRAYNEFAAAASIFLNTPGNAGKSVEAAMTSFSRGDVAAALFSQLVFQNGIIDRANGDKVLVAPGQVGINAGVIFDPVTTGFKGNVSFAPNTKDLVVIRALNEYRTHFEAVDYTQHASATTIHMFGNHCDVGGGYDNGFGAITLEAATKYFARSGVPIGQVLDTRKYISTPTINIHTEENAWAVSRRIGSPSDPVSEFHEFLALDYDKLTHRQTAGEVHQMPITAPDKSAIKMFNGDKVWVTLDTDGSVNREVLTTVGKTEITEYAARSVSGGPLEVMAEIGIDGSDGRLLTAQIDSGSELIKFGVGDSLQTKLSVSGLGTFTARIGMPSDNDVIDASATTNAVEIHLDAAAIPPVQAASMAASESMAAPVPPLTIRVVAGEAIKNAIGGSGDDIIIGNRIANHLSGGAGRDRIEGGDNDDTILGGAGNDDLQGGEGADLLSGGEDDDTLDGGAGNDSIDGGSGDDLLIGHGGVDMLVGGAGNDILVGLDGAGGDTLDGGAGFDEYTVDLNDVIRDSDGVGKVYLNTKLLGFATRTKGQTAYTDSNGNSYTVSNGTLYVNDPLVIEGFSNGGLGIYLDEKDTPDDKSPHRPVFDVRALIPRDPLVLDLNGDNQISTVSLATSSNFFDFNGDGIAEHSGWLSPVDGFLAIDLNNNGVVDGLSELFGTASTSGFTDLRNRIDSNRDGKVNALDTDFSRLKVWQDANGDGISQGAELQALAALQISEIDLAFTVKGQSLDGGVLANVGSFVQAGQTRLVGDMHFDIDFSNTAADPYRALETTGAVPSDIFALPWLRGYGAVKSTHIGYQESAQLKSYAHALAQRDYKDIVAETYGFLKLWTGLEGIRPTVAGANQTDTYLEMIWMLETVSGISTFKDEIASHFAAPTGRRFGFVNNSELVWSAFAEYRQSVAIAFAAQSYGKEWIQGAYYSLAKDRFLVMDEAKLHAALKGELAGLQGKDLAFALTLIHRLQADGAALDSSVILEGLQGTPNYAYLHTAVEEPELLRFTEYGHVWVHNLDGNALILNGDISYAGVTITNDDGLSIRVGDTPDFVRLPAGPVDLKTLVLGDGTSVDASAFLPAGLTYGRTTLATNGDDVFFGDHSYNVWSGYAGNDYLNGGGGSDKLSGGAGNDVLLGGTGNDTLDGGTGNDVLLGGTGNDTLVGGTGNDTFDGGAGDDRLEGGGDDDIFRFDHQSGNDTVSDSGGTETVQFGTGIAQSDITLVSRSTLGMTISFGPGNTLTALSDMGAGGIEQFTFADGTIVSRANMESRAVPTALADWVTGTAAGDTVDGGAGNDLMQGLEGNDVLMGGIGFDTLEGGQGDDTLTGGLGNDTIDGGAGVNTFHFAPGESTDTLLAPSGILQLHPDLTADRLIVTRAADTLYLHFSGNSQDEIRMIVPSVELWAADKNFSVQFADGSTLSVNQLISQIGIGTAFNDSIRTPDKPENYRVDGGAGDDYVYSDSGTDFLIGGLGNDHLLAYAGNDTLDGGAGDDRLYGGTGNDTLDGGTGDDRLVGETGNDTYLLSGAGGYDTVVEYDSPATDVNSFVFDSIVTPGNLLVSRGIDGAFILHSDAFAGVVTAHTHAADRIVFGDGSSQLLSSYTNLATRGTEANNSMVGTAGADKFDGAAGDDSISTGQGNDTLIGGRGGDTLAGGEGDDTYVFRAGDSPRRLNGYWQDLDQIIEQDATAGNTDVLLFAAGIAPAQVELKRMGNDLRVLVPSSGDLFDVIGFFKPDGTGVIENIRFSDGTNWATAGMTFSFGSSTADEIVGTTGDDLIEAYGGDDILQGNAGNDILDGGSGNDILNGNGGDDTIDGGAGDDVMYDSAGNDTYKFGNDSGHDHLAASWDEEATTHVDVIALAPGITLADLTLVTSGFHLVLSLNAGAATLSLGEWFRNSPRIHKIDTLRFADGTTGSLNNILYQFNGSAQNDTMLGTWRDESFIAGAGSDTVQAGGGNDTLDGGIGADLLVGGSGNDTYLFALGDGGTAAAPDRVSDQDPFTGDTLTFQAGIRPQDLVLQHHGDDLRISFTTSGDYLHIVNYFAPDGDGYIETIRFADGTVWTTLDVPIATAGDDFIVGTWRDDTFNGLGGNDNIQGGGGSDSLSGGSGNDTLEGGDGADSLIGGAGNDTLEGGDGTDSLIGGAGNDTYIVDWADTVSENADEGIDTIIGAHSLPVNFENLVAQPGMSDASVVGNAVANLLVGNDGPNWMAGGLGADTMQGGMGDDRYEVDNAGDMIVEAENGGIEHVLTYVSYTLPANVEDLQLFASTALTGTGNASDNVISLGGVAGTLYGMGGNDTLRGSSAGADKLYGGTGNDIYEITNTKDAVLELANEGTDAVRTTFSSTAPANVEGITLINAEAINATGNTLNNLLIGNMANNTLGGVAGNDIMQGMGGADTLNDTSGKNLFDGGAGNDTITGGTGNELFVGGKGNDLITTGTGADIIAFNRGDGQDIINPSVASDNIISLGGTGLVFADLSLQRTGNNLVLNLAQGDTITFKDWYLSGGNRSVAVLQLLKEGSLDTAPLSSTVPLTSFMQFNFGALITAFDQARVANPALTSWSMVSSLANHYIANSAGTLYGGDLTRGYGSTGDFSYLTYDNAVAVIGQTNFGSGMQGASSGMNAGGTGVYLV